MLTFRIEIGTNKMQIIVPDFHIGSVCKMVILVVMQRDGTLSCDHRQSPGHLEVEQQPASTERTKCACLQALNGHR